MKKSKSKKSRKWLATPLFRAIHWGFYPFFFSKAKGSFNNYLRGHKEVGGQLKVHGGYVNKDIDSI